MLNTVVAVGRTRLFVVIGLGAGSAVRLAIVVGVAAPRLIEPASGSVPVFTDQRSTPHVAAVASKPGAIGRKAAASASERRTARTEPAFVKERRGLVHCRRVPNM